MEFHPTHNFIFVRTPDALASAKMLPSPPKKSINPSTLCGKLTTHDPGTYIVLCLHCLHYFRSLTDLLRHRLLNHNILDNVAVGENLPRISKDGSWLVAGGDVEPQVPVPPPQQGLLPGMRTPSGVPTPSPPPPSIHIPQFRPSGPHHQMQSPQQFGYSQPTPPNRPVQSIHPPYPHGTYRPQNPYVSPQMMSNRGSAAPSPAPQYRPTNRTSTTTTFSPAAREFVPSGMFKAPSADDAMSTQPPSLPRLQIGYNSQ